MPIAAQIAANLAEVRERIALAAERAARLPSSIRLVAVTKTFPAETVRAAWECGLRDFGENRVQEFRQKLLQLKLPGARFHLIGHLQSNKVTEAMGFDWIQAVDSERLARRLNLAAAGKTPAVLIQVKLAQAGSESAAPSPLGRTGVPEQEAERLVDFVAAKTGLDLRGLMTVPPFTADPEGARPYFQRLRALRDRLQSAGFPQIQELSMGMTHDYPVAIEEGATIVRIGSGIFGRRATEPTTAPATEPT